MKCFLFLVFLWNTVFLNAQTVYEFKYNLKNKPASPDCQAFFLKHADGNVLCRIKYTDAASNQLVLIELAMKEKYFSLPDGLQDTTRLLYYATGTSMVTDAVNSKPDTSVSFLFTYNAGSGFLEPAAVLPPGAFAPVAGHAAAFTAVFIEKKKITRSFLLGYFNEEEEIVNDILSGGAKGLTPDEKSTTLWLITVANKNDKHIGNACNMDRIKIVQSFKDISTYLGIRMDTTIITGDNYSKASVEAALKKLKPKANKDIVVFYYSGHGYRRPGDGHKYPWIDLRGKPGQNYLTEALNMEDIYKTVKAKNARLTLVLSDCCNSDVEVTNAEGAKPMGSKDGGLNWLSENNCRNLFLSKTKKSYLVSAAGYGQRACSNNDFGSFFTFCFKANMEYCASVLGKNANWDEVFNKTYVKTVEKASNTCCDKPCTTAAHACDQKPIIEK